MSEKKLKGEATLRLMLRGQVRLSRAIGKEEWSPKMEDLTVDALIDIVEAWAEMNGLDLSAAKEPSHE